MIWIEEREEATNDNDDEMTKKSFSSANSDRKTISFDDYSAD